MGNSKTKPEQSNCKETNENDTPNTSNTSNTTQSLYPQLQIRNCIQNVRNNNSNFSEMYPHGTGTPYGS